MAYINVHGKDCLVPASVEDAILELAAANYALGAQKKGQPAQLLHRATVEAEVKLLIAIEAWVNESLTLMFTLAESEGE